MSNYNISVAGVKLPTGAKRVRLGVDLADGDISFGLLLEPAHAKAVGEQLIKAAEAVGRLIEIPGERFEGLRVSDLKAD